MIFSKISDDIAKCLINILAKVSNQLDKYSLDWKEEVHFANILFVLMGFFLL